VAYLSGSPQRVERRLSISLNENARTPSRPNSLARPATRHQVRHNALSLNRGDGTYAEKLLILPASMLPIGVGRSCSSMLISMATRISSLERPCLRHSGHGRLREISRQECRRAMMQRGKQLNIYPPLLVPMSHFIIVAIEPSKRPAGPGLRLHQCFPWYRLADLDNDATWTSW